MPPGLGWNPQADGRPQGLSPQGLLRLGQLNTVNHELK